MKRGKLINTHFFESLLILFSWLIGIWTGIPVIDYLYVVIATTSVFFTIMKWLINRFFNHPVGIWLVKSKIYRPYSEKIRDYLIEKLN